MEMIPRDAIQPPVVEDTTVLSDAYGPSETSVCIGIRRFNEPVCLNPEIETVSSLAKDVGACAMCETCEDRLISQAFEDKLTGLNNLHALSLVLEKFLTEDAPILMVFTDIRNFKIVNDTLGYSEGNSLIVSAAHLTESVVRDRDEVAAVAGRPGGDEMVILVQLVRRETDSEGNEMIVNIPPEEIPVVEASIANRIIESYDQMGKFRYYNVAWNLSGEKKLGVRVGTTVIFPSRERAEIGALTLGEFMGRADPKMHEFPWNNIA